MALRYTKVATADIATGKVSWCVDCGMLVFDQTKHDHFHSMLADGRTR